MIAIDPFKVLLPAVLSFLIGILIAPRLIGFLTRHKLWKKRSVQMALDGKPATISALIHNDERVPTPRMGGATVWLSVLAVALIFKLLAIFFPESIVQKLEFISRNQTWLPLFAMCVGAVLGGIDDLLVVEAIKGKIGGYVGGGLSMKVRLLVVTLLGFFASNWFYFKLGVSSLHIPFIGAMMMPGWLFILSFIIIMLATFSTGVIDGVDGLAGGVMSSAFIAYGAIAFAHNQIDIAALCFVIVGALYAFLWFNIPPAKFYLSETGMLSLTLTLTIIAYLTDAVAYLFIIAFPLYMTTASVILQLLSKKFRGKKIFKVAPVHHHFEASGWANYTVTMRYWIVSHICALLGVLLVMVS